MNLFVPNDNDGKECVINQGGGGLGDQLFVEPIFRHYHDIGYQVVSPTQKQYLWLQEYIPYVQFKDKETYKYNCEVVEQPNDGRLHVPLRFANPLYRGFADLHYGDDRKNWMRDKYLFLGLDEWKWSEMKWERKMDKEEQLFKSLGIEGEYNLVNQNWGGSFEKTNINPSNGLQSINVKKIDGFTMLDWGMVIENASTIHTVETAFVWPIEILNTKATELNMYPRYPPLENLNYFEGQLIKKWKLHDITSLQ